MRRASSKTTFLISVLLLSMLGGGAGVLLFSKANAVSSKPSIPPPHLIGAKLAQAAGKDAIVGDCYVLVEFIDYGDGTYDVLAGFHWGGDFGSGHHITDNQVLTAGNTITPDEQSAVGKFSHTNGNGSTVPYTNRNPVKTVDPFDSVDILTGKVNLLSARPQHGALVIDNLAVWN